MMTIDTIKLYRIHDALVDRTVCGVIGLAWIVGLSLLWIALTTWLLVVELMCFFVPSLAARRSRLRSRASCAQR